MSEWNLPLKNRRKSLENSPLLDAQTERAKLLFWLVIWEKIEQVL